MFHQLNRLFHTLWPLKPIQLWGLVYFRLVRRVFPFKLPRQFATTYEHHTVEFARYQLGSWYEVPELGLTLQNQRLGVAFSDQQCKILITW